MSVLKRKCPACGVYGCRSIGVRRDGANTWVHSRRCGTCGSTWDVVEQDGGAPVLGFIWRTKQGETLSAAARKLSKSRSKGAQASARRHGRRALTIKPEHLEH